MTTSNSTGTSRSDSYSGRFLSEDGHYINWTCTPEIAYGKEQNMYQYGLESEGDYSTNKPFTLEEIKKRGNRVSQAKEVFDHIKAHESTMSVETESSIKGSIDLGDKIMSWKVSTSNDEDTVLYGKDEGKESGATAYQVIKTMKGDRQGKMVLATQKRLEEMSSRKGGEGHDWKQVLDDIRSKESGLLQISNTVSLHIPNLLEIVQYQPQLPATVPPGN
ncbi:uncharacterized protein L201_002301 [Kwoniella dendrophila CBS 6074]|uniref:Uncharacterized protein n=1 Tax=Kwoniella dendrophila CBS 6074 TaxID=1295534 RepID=A0AAX4JPS7_9TREE